MLHFAYMTNPRLVTGIAIFVALYVSYNTWSYFNAEPTRLINATLRQSSAIEVNLDRMSTERRFDIASTNLQPVTVPGLEELVQISDIEIGDGAVVTGTSSVRVGYVGFLRDQTGNETVFDQNEGSFSFTLGQGQLIPGYEAGVVGMREGGRRLIVIQPEAGYGNRQVATIPANSVLYFIVEVHEVRN